MSPGAQGSVEMAGHSRTCDGPFPTGGAGSGCEQERRVGALQPSEEITAGGGRAEGIVLRGTYEQCSEGQTCPGLPCDLWSHHPFCTALLSSSICFPASYPLEPLPPVLTSLLFHLPQPSPYFWSFHTDSPPAITPSLVHWSGTSPLPAARVP